MNRPGMVGRSTAAAKRYTNGPYSVTVRGDGAIHVQPGDWLSKYSAALHNDFLHIHEYARRRMGSGELEPVTDPDRIRAGETLYHLPTVYTFDPMVIRGRPRKPEPVLSPAQKKQIILGALKRDYRIPGENLPILSKAIDIVGYAENAITLAEIAGLVAEGGAVASTGTGLAIAGVFLFPVGAGISLMNAWETGEKLYAMRGIAYSTTAWAFGDVPPSGSPAILRNIRQQFPDTSRYEQGWREASSDAIRTLEKEATRRMPASSSAKRSMQVMLQAAGDGDRRTLSKVLLTGLGTQLKGIELRVWESNYATTYKD